MYQLKGYAKNNARLRLGVPSQRAWGDSGVGVIGHWGDGAMGQTRKWSHALMLQHLFCVSDMMLENQLSRSFTLKLIRIRWNVKGPNLS